MPAREDDFRVADEMRAAAIRVSIQIVQKKLPDAESADPRDLWRPEG